MIGFLAKSAMQRLRPTGGFVLGVVLLARSPYKYIISDFRRNFG